MIKYEGVINDIIYCTSINSDIFIKRFDFLEK
jgi:hypothetical protein